MKRRRFFLGLALASLACYSGILLINYPTEQAAFINWNENLQDGNYQIDHVASTLKWMGKKITYGHHGTLRLNQGNLEVSGGKVTAGEFEMNMMSIKNKNITDAKRNKRLVGHLKSADFFNVEEYSATWSI